MAFCSRNLPRLIILECMSYARHPDCARALALGHRLADSARKIALGYFRNPIAVEQKADRSPVTVADRAIETEMRRMIAAEFPAHGIRGEEFAGQDGAEYTWVLDPIDGTKSFISGYPLFGSLIALTAGVRAVLGIIEAPAMRERWVGIEGAATVCNGTPVRTSSCASIEQARVYSTTADAFGEERLRRYDTYTRRASIRQSIGETSCASSTTRWPKVQVRSSRARSATLIDGPPAANRSASMSAVSMPPASPVISRTPRA